VDKFVICGPSVLKGKIRIEGSKNAALPILAGTLLIDKGESVIKNVPPLKDTLTLVKMLEYLGARVTFDEKAQVVTVSAENVNKNTAPYELVRQMRGSFLVLGPLLSRFGEARISLPGGCSLGPRPVDYHIKGFEAVGAKVTEKGGYVIAKAKELRGGSVVFDRPTHTGTENIIFGSVFSKGKTTITNAGCDPEIVDVARFLNKAGAKIHGAGTPDILIEPVRKLRAVEHTIQGDRLVAGTYMFGAAITGGKVEISGVPSDQLIMVTKKLSEMGCKIVTKKNSLTVQGPRRLAPVSITTFPFPGFPTDLQACLMAAATVASGTSHIAETVFVDRFSHSMELRRLGAEIIVSNTEATVQGVDQLHGAQVMAPDIRAGAGIMLACLAAQGESQLLRVYHIDRAYDRPEGKLSSLGADIKRVRA